MEPPIGIEPMTYALRVQLTSPQEQRNPIRLGPSLLIRSHGYRLNPKHLRTRCGLQSVIRRSCPADMLAGLRPALGAGAGILVRRVAMRVERRTRRIKTKKVHAGYLMGDRGIEVARRELGDRWLLIASFDHQIPLPLAWSAE